MKPATALLRRHAIELDALAKARPDNEALKDRAATARRLFEDALAAEEELQDFSQPSGDEPESR